MSSPLTPVSVVVVPATASFPEDGAMQFAAVGTFADSHTEDVTYRAEWTTFFSTHATESLTHPGKVLGVSPGTCTLAAAVYDPSGEITSTPAALTVTAAGTPAPDPEGRFLLAFGQQTLEAYPEWTRLDEVYPNLVTSYSIDRGRQYELDRFDTGRAQVEIADPDGTLDPLNPDGPFYGAPGPYGPLLQPLMQAAIGRQNPVTGEWETRYRGFVDNLSYQFDPSQQLNRLTVSLVDLFELLAAAEMQPGIFGVSSSVVPGNWPRPPAGSEGQIWFPDQPVEERFAMALSGFGLPRKFYVAFPSNVVCQAVIYSPGESPLTVLQEAADAELPGANVFCDRRGRVCFRDRFARFYPAESAAAAGPARWDYHEWKVGDGAAVEASISDTVQLREFAFDRGVSRLINSASIAPAGIEDADAAGQLVTEPESVAFYGVRSYSADGLLTKYSLLDGSDALAECRNFAWFFVVNFKWLRDRITTIGFRPLHPDDPRAPALWEFLNSVDIGDLVDITISSPGGGGYTNYQHFVEGIHEQVRPLTPDYDDVTLHLDLSPMADYETNPWPAPPGFNFAARTVETG